MYMQILSLPHYVILSSDYSISSNMNAYFSLSVFHTTKASNVNSHPHKHITKKVLITDAIKYWFGIVKSYQNN